MALPTKNLPFEYQQRWTEVGPLVKPDMDADTLNVLNKRDKDLEDYLATLGTGGCACSWMHAFSVSDDIVLSAATSAFVDTTWTSITEQSGGWSTSGGFLVPPDDQVLYHVYASGFFNQSSGTDAVQGCLIISDNATTAESWGYSPGSGWGMCQQVGRLATIDTTSFYVSGVLQAPAAATRSMGFYADLWAISTCCTGPY